MYSRVRQGNAGGGTLPLAFTSSSASTSTIEDLHPELLAEIFRLCAATAEPFKTWKTLNMITSVSTQWRSCAIKDQVLWSKVQLSRECTPAIQLIKAWVERSGNTCLDLLIDWQTPPVGEEEVYREQTLALLLVTCSRWRTIDFTFTEDELDQLGQVTQAFTSLEHLRLASYMGAVFTDLVPPFRVFLNAPALRTVDIDADDEPFRCQLPWSQLKKYSSLNTTVPGCLWLINQCYNLVELEMKLANIEVDRNYLDHPLPVPQTLPHLLSWSIRVCPDHQDIPEMLDRVICPSLTSLRLSRELERDGPDDVVPLHISSFLVTSGCSLRCLKLIVLPLAGTELVDILTHTPMLEDLTVAANAFGLGPLVFTRDVILGLTRSTSHSGRSHSGSPLLAPQLRSLSLTGIMLNDISLLVDLVASRIGKSRWNGIISPSERVTRLRLAKFQRDGPLINSPLMSQIDDWRNEGYDVLIKGYPGSDSGSDSGSD